MAEWSIAAVLKTAGLTAPGVRIPLLPFQGGRFTLKLSEMQLEVAMHLGIEYRRDEASEKLIFFVNCWYFISFVILKGYFHGTENVH